MRDNGTLIFLHGDHLGSSRLTTASTGSIVSARAYYPFGGLRLSAGMRPTTLDFTGQRLDGTGLHFVRHPRSERSERRGATTLATTTAGWAGLSALIRLCRSRG